MAITKIHPIKTTLSLSIDYICDSQKTDEEILIYSYKCGYKIASLQFENTKEVMNSQCKNLARHLIQSFAPGEATPILAHKIGQELCHMHLKCKYEYVMTTHIDKGHIHNHIIFNNVSYVDGKSYISNKKSYHQIRNASDAICRENGLSTISSTLQLNNKTKGKSYKEYQEHKSGNSYKAKLKYAIDLSIKKTKNWDEFMALMKEYGYEIKDGKHISFKATNQERFTRAKTIGLDYSEERIKERINDRVNNKIITTKKRRTPTQVIDIKSNHLASKSVGFARWLKLQNIKNMAKTWQTINANNITDINLFYEEVDQIHDGLIKIQGELKSIEILIQETADKILTVNTYKKYKSIYTCYNTSTDKDAYFRMHESKIILFEAAKTSLTINDKVDFIPSIPSLREEIYSLNKSKKILTSQLSMQKKKVSDINQLKDNLETYLRTERVTYISQQDRLKKR